MRSRAALKPDTRRANVSDVTRGAQMPHLHHDFCVHPPTPGQGRADDSSVQ
jgi:hypothetical protein